MVKEVAVANISNVAAVVVVAAGEMMAGTTVAAVVVDLRKKDIKVSGIEIVKRLIRASNQPFFYCPHFTLYLLCKYIKKSTELAQLTNYIICIPSK